MLNKIKSIRWIFTSFILLVVVACSDSGNVPSEKSNNLQSTLVTLDVYKSASCSCCNKWINYIENNGLKAIKHNQSNLTQIKEKFSIHPKLRSCHTSVSKDGFVFEGHIPAKFIKQFLKEKPANSRGLAVPRMPTGTPGMEFGDLLQPYKIYLLKTDGSIEIYAEVNSAKEQI